MARPELGPTALDINRYLYLFLPKKVKMENGDKIDIEWYDGDASIENTLQVGQTIAFPYGTFLYQRTVDQSAIPRARETIPYADDAFTDTLTFDEDQWVYSLTNPDLKSPGYIEEVKGTVGGVANTVIPSVNYRAAGTEPEVLDVFEFIGPVFPDDGTQFTIKYHPRRVLKTDVTEGYPVWRIGIHCQDLATGQRGATRPYAKEEVAQQTIDYLLQYFMWKRGQTIGPVPNSLVWKGPYNVGFNVVDDAQHTRRAWIDVYAYRRRIVPVADVEAVGPINRLAEPSL